MKRNSLGRKKTRQIVIYRNQETTLTRKDLNLQFELLKFGLQNFLSKLSKLFFHHGKFYFHAAKRL